MSAFDVNKFMELGTSEMGDTKPKTIPNGDYPGIVDKIDPREVQRKDGSGSFVSLDIYWKLNLDAAAQKVIGRDSAVVRQSIIPDIDQNGGLDMSAGKNIKLNQVREACGLVKGFNFGKLQGAGPALVRVTSRPDKNDPEKIYNDVALVGKLK